MNDSDILGKEEKQQYLVNAKLKSSDAEFRKKSFKVRLKNIFTFSMRLWWTTNEAIQSSEFFGGWRWLIHFCMYFFFIKLSSLCSFFLTLSWWVSIRNLTLIVGSIYLSRDCWVILLLCNWNFPTELANFLCFCSCLTAIEASECPCNTRIYENIM